MPTPQRRRLLLLEAAALLPFADSFPGADGALGNGWLNASWQIASHQALSNPTLVNVALNPTLDNWSGGFPVSFSHSTTPTSTITQETVNVHTPGGSAVALNIDASNDSANINQSTSPGIGFIERSMWLRSDSGTPSVRITGGAGRSITISATYAQYFETLWSATGTSGINFVRAGGSNSHTLYGDDPVDALVKLSDALDLRFFDDVNTDGGVQCTIIPGTLAGWGCNWDSQGTPKYGLIAYLDGIPGTNASTFHFVKIVNGVRTELPNYPVSLNYVAGATVRIVVSGSLATAYYQGLPVAAAVDISAETGIINNKLCGMFNTNTGNRLTNPFVLPR